MDNEKNEVRKKTLISSAYILIDDNNMLFFSLYGGIYHFDIDRMQYEFVGLLEKCIKKRYKVRSVFKANGRILIVFSNTYNIAEYDLECNSERLLTDIPEPPSHKDIGITNAFLIDGKLWIFPYELKDRIMSYDIGNSRADFYAIDEITAGREKFDVDISGGSIFRLSYGEGHIWTTLKAGRYGIRFDFENGFRANLYSLNSDVMYAGADYIDDSLYLPVVREERVDRYDLCFQYIEPIRFNEGKTDISICYRNIVSGGQMLFAIPYTHDGIHFLDRSSENTGKLDFPDGFKKNTLPFWNGIPVGDRIVIPPYYSNMLLKIDGAKSGNLTLQAVRMERDPREIRPWLNYLVTENETWTLSGFIGKLDDYPPDRISGSDHMGSKLCDYLMQGRG